MTITQEDYDYQVKQYQDRIALLIQKWDEQSLKVAQLQIQLNRATIENARLIGQLQGTPVGAIVTKVIDAASALLSDVRWPNEVARHMLAGRIAKPPLEKLRGLYAEELAAERLAGARALVDMLPDPDDWRST